MMDCVQGDLKTETASFVDNLFVDQLLDFSNGFSEPEMMQEEEGDWKEQGKEEVCCFYQEKLCSAAEYDLGPLSCGEIAVPAEDLESLEWLSNFVDDSFSDYSLTVKLPPANNSAPVKEQRCFTAPVQTKARTKRARTGVRVWPVLSPSATESSSSSSSTHSTTSFPPLPVQYRPEETLALKPKRKPSPGTVPLPVQPRRCCHCGVTKTPQWRAGPLGSKTLCNACGVRFKSGRLLPEYRPACSPTFSSEIHSNNHRKVLEMRRKKEWEIGPAGLASPVQRF